VIAVGGTTLEKVENSRGWSEKVWVGSGSGCSWYESKPSWQTDTGCAKRTDNDTAAVANNDESPVSIYNTPVFGSSEGEHKGWADVGGTSVAAPLVAGIEAHASSTVKDEGAEAFYRSSLFNVTSGYNGVCGHAYLCTGVEGYNAPTGWGTPDGPPELAAGFAAVTDPATSAGGTEVTLNGYVNPKQLETTYHFEYGPTTSYGTSVPVPNASAGSGALWREVSQRVTGVTTQGTYHYRLVATNSSGTIDGADHTFTTTPWTIQTTPRPAATWEEGGASWEKKPEGLSCVSSAACIAVSSYFDDEAGERVALVDGWNGSEWKIQSTAKPAGATGVGMSGVSCSSSTECTAVGYYHTKSSLGATLAERWNGKEWSLQTTPNPTGAIASDLHGVSCASSTECVAVGVSTNSSYTEVTLAERWNGKEWSLQTTPNPTGSEKSGLNQVSCTSSTACTAVGYGSISKRLAPLAERWNGTEWAIQTTPTPEGTREATFDGVSCTSSTACTAVGSYWTTSNIEKTLAERWNGTEWAIQATPNPEAFTVGENGSGLNGVSCSGTAECIAVGNSEYESYFIEGTYYGDGVTLAERWNGKEWEIDGTPMPEEPLWFEGAWLADVSCLPSTTICTALGAHFESEKPFEPFLGPLTERRAFKPGVETLKASSVGRREATLKGSVNPEGTETKSYFEYGLKEAKEGKYQHKTAEVGAGSGKSTVQEPQVITGLEPGTTYHFRIVASNSNGVSDGNDQTFTTKAKAPAPAATTGSATGVNETGATLSGTVNPNEAETKYYFEYGLKEAEGGKYEHRTAEASAGSGTSNIEESKGIVGLEKGTTYHFRLVASNESGTTYGADKTFTTTTTPAWRITSTPNPTGEKTSLLEGDSCSSPGACTAVGYYKNSSGTKLALAEAWNGEWQEQTLAKPSGAKESELDEVSCTSSNACTAVGSYLNSSSVAVPLAERWNGEAWSVEEAPAPSGAKESGLFSVSCASSSACTATGAYINSSSAYVAFAESWNGTSWSVKETPIPSGGQMSQLIGVSCSAAGECTAVGEYESSTSVWESLADRWNGEKWTLQEPPSPTGATLTWPEDVSCISSTMCVIVGFYEPSEGGSKTLAESWNGKTWSIQTTANPGSQSSRLRGVSCTSSTSCTAVGFYDQGEPTEEMPLAENWNGTAWSTQTIPHPSGAPYSNLRRVSCTSSVACAAVGRYTKSKGEEAITLAELYG
jgi:hypothetical protein